LKTWNTADGILFVDTMEKVRAYDDAVTCLKFLPIYKIITTLASSFFSNASASSNMRQPDEISLCFSWIRKVSREVRVFPSSLILEGVEQLQNGPVACGGFADIYKGSYQGKLVAIKFIRFNNTVQKTTQVQRVRHRLHLNIDCPPEKYSNFLRKHFTGSNLSMSTFCHALA
jgi:hypothetical protein